jgi:hypothetical protein
VPAEAWADFDRKMEIWREAYRGRHEEGAG